MDSCKEVKKQPQGSLWLKDSRFQANDLFEPCQIINQDKASFLPGALTESL